jgi:hypothetical protein
MLADRARVQTIVHRPLRRRAAGTRTRVESVLTRLMANRTLPRRAAAVSMEAEGRLTAAADIPAGPTTSNQSLPLQAAGCANLGGAYRLCRFAFGQTSLYDRIVAGLDHLKQGNRDKKVLILFTDGGDTASKHSQGEVVDLAQQFAAAIYAIGIFDEQDGDQNRLS